MALVEDQRSVDDAPAEMVDGVSVRLTVGAAKSTVRLVLPLPLPLGPEQVSTKLWVPSAGLTGSEPLVARAPDQAPLALQLLASVVDHCSVALSPTRTTLGATVRLTLGARMAPSTTRLADLELVPVALLHTKR